MLKPRASEQDLHVDDRHAGLQGSVVKFALGTVSRVSRTSSGTSFSTGSSF